MKRAIVQEFLLISQICKTKEEDAAHVVSPTQWTKGETEGCSAAKFGFGKFMMVAVGLNPVSVFHLAAARQVFQLPLSCSAWQAKTRTKCVQGPLWLSVVPGCPLSRRPALFRESLGVFPVHRAASGYAAAFSVPLSRSVFSITSSVRYARCGSVGSLYTSSAGSPSSVMA